MSFVKFGFIRSIRIEKGGKMSQLSRLGLEREVFCHTFANYNMSFFPLFIFPIMDLERQIQRGTI